MAFPTEDYSVNTLRVIIKALQDGTDEMENIDFTFASPVSGGVLENSGSLDVVIQAFADALAAAWPLPNYVIKVTKEYRSGKNDSFTVNPSA